MADKIFPIQEGGLTVGGPIVPASEDSTYGTHFSYLGVGGYIEVPTSDYRNGIPVGSNINADGYSSGRRRFGMMVYVIEDNALYRLSPTKADGNKVTLSDWDSASEAQNNGEPNINLDLSDLDDRFVYAGGYNAGELTLNISGADDVVIPLQGLVNTIADTASFDASTNNIVFSSDGGGSLFSVDLSALKDNEDNLVASEAVEGEVDVVTEEELSQRINEDFSDYLDTNLDSLV